MRLRIRRHAGGVRGEPAVAAGLAVDPRGERPAPGRALGFPPFQTPQAAADGRLRQNHPHFFGDAPFEGLEYFCKSAGGGGCVDILKWAMDVNIFKSWFSYEASDAARRNGHTELADWLEDRHNKEAQCPACAGRGTVAACEVDQIYME